MPALAVRPVSRPTAATQWRRRRRQPGLPVVGATLGDNAESNGAGPTPTTPTSLPSNIALHFAYGANMDPAVLARRGVSPLWHTPAMASRAIRLAFSHRAAFASLEEEEEGGGGAGEGGAAGAAPPAWPVAPHGVLYGLTEADWATLVRAEGGYRVRTVEVVPYGVGGGANPPALSGAAPTPAAAFFSSPWATLKSGSLPPRRAYLDTLLTGAAARGVDEGYRAWLGGLEVAEVEPGRGLPPPYFDTLGRDAVLIGALALAGGMLGWALVGGLM